MAVTLFPADFIISQKKKNGWHLFQLILGLSCDESKPIPQHLGWPGLRYSKPQGCFNGSGLASLRSTSAPATQAESRGRMNVHLYGNDNPWKSATVDLGLEANMQRVLVHSLAEVRTLGERL